jgi:hypothetical protein
MFVSVTAVVTVIDIIHIVSSNLHVKLTAVGTLWHWHCSWFRFDIYVTVHRDKFLMIKPTSALISQIYSWNETLHVSDSFSVHRQEFSMSSGVFHCMHTAVVYVIQVCWKLVSRIRVEHLRNYLLLILLTSCQQTCMTYTIAVCTVKNSWW